MDFFVNQFESKMINLSSTFEKQKNSQNSFFYVKMQLLEMRSEFVHFDGKYSFFREIAKVTPIRFHEFLFKSFNYSLYFDRVNIKNWAVIVFSQKIEDSQLKLAFWIHFSNRYLSPQSAAPSIIFGDAVWISTDYWALSQMNFPIIATTWASGVMVSLSNYDQKTK